MSTNFAGMSLKMVLWSATQRTVHGTTSANILVHLHLVSFSLHVNSLLVSMKGSICEAFAVILSKELAVTQSDVVDLVAGATSIHPLPLLWRLLSFSASSQGKYSQTFDGLVNLIPFYQAGMHAVFTNTKQSKLFEIIISQD